MALTKLITAWSFQNALITNSHRHTLVEALETLTRPMRHGRINLISEGTKRGAYPSMTPPHSNGPSIFHHRALLGKAVKMPCENSFYLKNYSSLRSRLNLDNSRPI